MKKTWVVVLLCSTLLPQGVFAEDWPEWRGKGRLGVWNETEILDKFPADGLRVKWRTPVHGGYAGPAVADGRVFITDYMPDPDSKIMEGKERLLCLDEKTGVVIWRHEWKISYAVLMASYAIGPRATPTVDANRVFAVGATGELRCVDVASGKLIWSKSSIKDFATEVPISGVSSAPIINGNMIIAIVGGKPDAQVVAFDKTDGREIWRALSPQPEMGYGQPILINAGGRRQLIFWHPEALYSLDPETGAIYWQQPFEAGLAMTVATPVQNGPYLMVSQFNNGSLMMKLDDRSPKATKVWQGKSRSEMPDKSDGLHALITTPVIDGDFIYGVCSYGQLRGIDLLTGKRVWESLEMIELSRWAAAFIVRQGDRYFINNDKGDLIIARFTPQGYREIDRTRLIEPTSNSAWGSRPGRPKRGDRIVNWSHPAYANGHIFARNDKEIICASLLGE